MEAPIVSFVGKGDNLFMSFTDGRHRFSQLRDAGAESIALSMSPKYAEIARNLGLEKINIPSNEIQKLSGVSSPGDDKNL